MPSPARLCLPSSSPALLISAYRVNEEVGPFRAAAAQADVLHTAANLVPQEMWDKAVRKTLGEVQTVETLKELQQMWDAQAQDGARKILIDMHERIASSFKDLTDRTRFLDAVGSCK
jgi:hypothetical protein